jgi:hypothetical protein
MIVRIKSDLKWTQTFYALIPTQIWWTHFTLDSILNYLSKQKKKIQTIKFAQSDIIVQTLFTWILLERHQSPILESVSFNLNPLSEEQFYNRVTNKN